MPLYQDAQWVKRSPTLMSIMPPRPGTCVKSVWLPRRGMTGQLGARTETGHLALPVADQLGVVLLIGLDIQIADIVAIVHKGRRFDEKDIDADAIAGAAPDGFAKLGQMHVGAAAEAGQNRDRHRVPERDRQPQGVDAFVGQPVQVFVRVVVDLVFQTRPGSLAAA